MPGCLGCTCSTPRTTSPSGRLVLATQVDHTATALRSLAARSGLSVRCLAPGLLALDTGGAGFLARATSELTSVEADEVRCLVLDEADLPDVALLGQALTAPTLAASGARAQHADLLPLFADEQGCFSSVYQPILDLRTGTRIGYEALLRAEHPDGRAVLPDVLFPAAQAAGWTHLVDRIGRTTALRDAGPWLPADELLFINFVPTSIYRPEVCLRTTEIAAREAGVRLDQLVFEVSEGHQVRDVQHLERVFAYYRSHRCQVALDDVGAGWSSLNLLVRLHPDVVKLDREIVQALPDATSTAVVRAVVDITHAYGGRVLAECVETQEQADAARALGVDLVQGWLFGRPERPAGVARRPAQAAPPVLVDPGRPDAPVAVAGGTLSASTGPDGMSGLLVRAVDGSLTAVVVVDVQADDAPMLYVNPAFESLTGYAADEVLGRNCRLLQGPQTDPAAVRALADAVRHGLEHRAVLRNYRKDGTPWWNELHLSPVVDAAGRLTHYLGYQHDVTARVEAQEELARRATQDSLTGLANRAHLMQVLDASLPGAREDGRAVGVLFLDLDGFKAVNDGHGHAAGDGVLVQVAERLRLALRSSDLVCRHGGDEFVAVLTDLDPLDARRVVERAAQDVVACLRRPFVVGGGQAPLAGSVGVALFPDDGVSATQLLARADRQMYAAKPSPPTARASGAAASSTPPPAPAATTATPALPAAAPGRAAGRT